MIHFLVQAWDALGSRPLARCAAYSAANLRSDRICDLAIWAAYWCFPFLAWAALSRSGGIRFPFFKLLTGAFIIFCGSTHLMDVLTGYYPSLIPVASGLRVATALVSWAAVFAVEGAIHRIRQLKVEPTLAEAVGLSAASSVRTYAVLVGLAVAVAGVGAWSYTAIGGLMTQIRERRAEAQADRSLFEAVYRLSRSESAQRGYLIDGAGVFARSYRSQASASRRLLERSRSSPVWAAGDFEAVLRDASAKLAELDQTVAMAEAGDRAGAVAVFSDDRGRRLMAEVESRYEAMSGATAARAAGRVAAMERSARAALVAIPCSVALSILIVGGSIASLSRQARAAAAEAARAERLRIIAELHAVEAAQLAAEARAAIAEKQSALIQAEIANHQVRVAEAENLRNAHLLSSVSHDTRTPLNAIRQQAQLAMMYATLPALESYREKLVACLETTIASTNAAKRIVDTLLEAARYEQSAPAVATFDAHALLREVAQFLRAFADPKGLLLAVHCEGGVEARTDRHLVHRALINLGENAIKYTPSGSVTLSAARSGDGSGVEIRVADTGPGIDPAILPRLFGDFVQAGNPERDASKGFGLGLANVRRMATRLGGRVRVEGGPGRGSTFVLELPDLIDRG